jgi:four helix bundle protein
MARGSLLELQNQLLIAKDIKILSDGKFGDLSEQSVMVHKLINGLIKSVKDAK